MAYNPLEEQRRRSLLRDMDPAEGEDFGPSPAPDGPLPSSPSPSLSVGTEPVGTPQPLPTSPWSGGVDFGNATFGDASPQYGHSSWAREDRENSSSPVASAPLEASQTPAPSAYNREALSQAIQGIQFSGDRGDALAGRSMYNPSEFIAKNQGGFAQGVTMVSPDKIRLPDGEIVDIGANVDPSGRAGAWWGSEKDSAANRGSSGVGVGQGGATTGITSAAGGVGGGMPNGGDGELQAAVRAQLLKLMGNQKPIDVENDPRAIAYRRARQRGASNERATLAERAAFSGLNSGGQGSGAFDTGVQGIQEGAGEDIAGYEAGLAGEEVQARRQQLMQALDLANAVGARTEALALQKQLAEMDNTYRYANLGEQGRQFNESSDFSWTQLEAALNRQAYLDALGGGS